MRWGVPRAGVLATVAAGLLAVLPATAEAGEQVIPRNGTYAGAGTMDGNATYGMTVGFILKNGTVDVRILGFEMPGCSGYTTVPTTTLGANRFSTTGNNSNQQTQLNGRWVKPAKVRGKMAITVHPASTCGIQGNYVYKYSARRYR